MIGFTLWSYLSAQKEDDFMDKEEIKIKLTRQEVGLIDSLDSAGELDNCYFEGREGWQFIATPKNVRLLEDILLKPVCQLVDRLNEAIGRDNVC